MSDEGEDPSSPRHKRKIKKVMVLSSASSSDSDDSGPTTSTRRKRMRVLSEEDSDSSSGSWAVGAIRRRRALPGLRDSDGESYSSGWATDQSDAPAVSATPSTSAAPSKSPSNKAPKAASGFSSDSSEGNSEKCSICLMKFLNQEVGTPQNCEHIFCLDCITEWSRNMNTCPVDRIIFNSIVVRACAGGRVLRTEVVKVEERRPSLEMMIMEDPTVCEICHNADHEESMLLCDGCDLGFHMQCLTPPLTRIPEDQWLCRYCNNVWRSAVLETHDGPIRATREAERWSNVNVSVLVPSTSRSGPPTSRPAASSSRPAASTSRPTPSSSHSSRAHGGASSSTRRITTRTRKRKYKRRTRTVIVEYKVEGEGKIPITKTRRIKTRLKKRKVKKRQPRTAARRTHVLASVRAKLATIRSEGRGGAAERGELSARRACAGIPALSLFGASHQLDYFEEDDEHGSEGASTAVAARPTSAILSAYRQARRKMVTIPSPSHASSAPDILSNILESQTLLHSRRSVVSLTVGGSLNIELQTHGTEQTQNSGKGPPVVDKDKPLVEKKGVDLTKAQGARQAPMYPGQGRGWGGGYRYPREQNNQHHNQNHGNQGYGRGGYDNGFGGAPRAPPGPFDRRDDNNGPFNDYDNRRPNHYANDDDPWHHRNRRPDQNRGPNHQRHEERRFSGGPAWRAPRPPAAGPPHRQSFGGFENPLDMRMGHEAGPPSVGYSRALPSFAEPPQDKPQPYQPLPRPPSFDFEVAPALEEAAGEGDEDERSDEGLIIDTEKYDPTEPTHDDDSGDEQRAAPPSPPPHSPPPSPPPPPLPPDAASVDAILAGISSSGLNVPADILDSAVRQALEEHRALLGPVAEGDCPNFSIYSATSVHIASDCSRPAPAAPPPAPAAPPTPRRDSLEDLVQQDGDLTPPPPPDPAERSLQEYKAKVSKRCPITTSTRNPIKIKLVTPSLIKRHVSLYDDEDVDPDTQPPQLLEPPQPPANDDEPAGHERIEDEKIPSELEVEQPTTPDDKEHGGRRSPSSAHLSDEDATPDDKEEVDDDKEEVDDDVSGDELGNKDKSKSDSEGSASTRSGSAARAAMMTESISETEDERSYTPCLDEHKEAPPADPADPAGPADQVIEELGTELISEEEAQDMFSEGSPAPLTQPESAPAALPEDGEILDKRPKDDSKKKRRKEAKKEARAKGRKRGDVTFKKIGKGKERNYRDRDKNKDKRRSLSSSGSRDRRRRKDKRKDLERYDVRTLLSERRRRAKDAFGRDVSPAPSEPERRASSSPSPRRARLFSQSPVRRRASSSPRRLRHSPSPRRARISPEPPRRRISPSPPRRRISPSPPRRRISPSPPRRRISPSPPRRRASPSPPRRRASPSPPRRRASPSPPRRAPSAASMRRSPSPKRRRKRSGSRAKAPRRRTSTSKARKRRRSPSPAPTPKPVKAKKKKRARPSRADSKARSPAAAAAAVAVAAVRRRSLRRKRVRRRSPSPSPPAAAAPPAWSPPRALSPRTPPPALPVPLEERRRRRDMERAHRRLREATGPSKEVFTSGDNILVSVSFKEAARAEGAGRRARRLSRRRRRAAPDAGPKPVAIIDLERSPFRELTPSPKHVIVLSDDEAESSSAAPAPVAPEPAPAQGQGPKTPPDPREAAPAVEASPPAPAPEASEGRGPLTPPEPPDSPDAYDPYEPTRSASGSPAAPPPPAPSPAPPATLTERPSMTLEAAQKTNLSADEVLDRRPLSPIEKVMALLQSTRDESPEAPVARAAGASPPALPSPPAPLLAPPAPPPAPAAAAAPRVLLPEVPRAPPKLFLAKPSPIKSDPIKPMPQATKLSRLPLPAVVCGVRRRSLSPGGAGGASPYSPGSSDFGDLFEPPQPLYKRAHKRNGKKRNKNKTTVDVKLDDDHLQILDELPSSAVEMQVKSKFLKKLNRQERVVEEVKLVLKPHYNKKHVSKDEYKHILRRAVPKICHNKTGEINPMKIQSLVEAYVKKFRKKRKLGQ